mmetsp:Transcript_19441/g.45175  ORF Transcript_19441/g.45175 Transcript_19441/m.45175 type:complete len:267 (+) Transcript_19441:266-1066(+)
MSWSNAVSVSALPARLSNRRARRSSVNRTASKTGCGFGALAFASTPGAGSGSTSFTEASSKIPRSIDMKNSENSCLSISPSPLASISRNSWRMLWPFRAAYRRATFTANSLAPYSSARCRSCTSRSKRFDRLSMRRSRSSNLPIFLESMRRSGTRRSFTSSRWEASKPLGSSSIFCCTASATSRASCMMVWQFLHREMSSLSSIALRASSSRGTSACSTFTTACSTVSTCCSMRATFVSNSALKTARTLSRASRACLRFRSRSNSL